MKLYHVWTNRNGSERWELDSTFDEPSDAYARVEEWTKRPLYVDEGTFEDIAPKAIVTTSVHD